MATAYVHPSNKDVTLDLSAAEAADLINALSEIPSIIVRHPETVSIWSALMAQIAPVTPA